MNDRQSRQSSRLYAILALAAAAFAGAGSWIFASSAQAQTETTTQELCAAAWADSDAQAWCDATVSVASIGGTNSARCGLDATCTLTLAGAGRVDVNLSGTTEMASATLTSLEHARVCAKYRPPVFGIGDDGRQTIVTEGGWHDLYVSDIDCSGEHNYTPAELENNGFTVTR